MALLDNLKWRAAIKQFDPNKKLTPQQLDDLLTAVQLSPSSYGLQPYRILVVEDAAVRAKLREASYGQSQFTDASQVIVFAAETVIDAQLVKSYIDETAEVRHIDRANLTGFEQMMLGTVNSKSADELITWAQKQVYIAAGVLNVAAAEMHIDTCTMEGFDPAAFDEILGLKEKGLTATLVMTLGFRATDDVYSKMPKVRKPADKLFLHV